MGPRPAWTPAYVGLGSNLEDPPVQIHRACGALHGLPRCMLVAVSALYRNPPMGPQDQPWYVNAVAGLLTQLSPWELLDALKSIEAAHGRTRRPADRWGPRVIDLDLLVYGATRVEEAGLSLPHAGIAQRNFVLFPLLEVAPTLDVPGLGRVSDLAARVDGSRLERIC